MLLLNLCDNSGPLTLFYIIKILFEMLCVVLPILIMFKFISALFKVVVSGKDIKNEILVGVKGLIAGLVIFLLPSIFSFIFVDLLGTSDVEVVICFNDANLVNIQKLREEEVINAREELDAENKQKAEEINKDREIEERKRAEQNKFFEEFRKKKEEEAANNNNNNNSNNNGTSNTLSSGDINIFVGDSRTVGMCIAMTKDSSGCSYSIGGAKYSDSDIYIAEGSMSYSWFNSTAVPAINSIISNNPNIKFNIYSLMGVNMLLYDIDKYIPLYNSLASGSFANHNLILVSVNPVNETIEAQHGYSTKNNDIQTFNSKLKAGVSGSNVKYCDTYTSLLNNISTSDGLHYSTTTYQVVYNKILLCSS